jgi:hypothetical protein
MFRCVTNITFIQQPNSAWPLRKKTLTYNFVHEFEAEDSWSSLTNKAKITVPKNVYVIDATGKRVSLSGTNVNIGGFSSNPPIFLRGDKVTIEAGYKYFVDGNETAVTNTMFSGFVTNVSSRIPIEIECEDNMYLLKQIIAPNKVFPAKLYTLETMLTELLKGSGFTVRKGVSTSFGDFRTQNETICEVLARIQKDYHFESYFRGSELRTGFPIYVEQDAIDDGPKWFLFNRGFRLSKKYGLQGSVIKDQLEYKRRDDVNLSAIAYSVNKNELQITTKDGHQKTKSERLEVLVNVRNGEYISSVKPTGQKADFAPSTAGERRTFYFWNVKTTAELIALATEELKKYYYTGLRGKFTTFGLPFVRQGDNITLDDNILPERNGVYKVKSVKYTGGVNGLRQEISLDYKIS